MRQFKQCVPYFLSLFLVLGFLGSARADEPVNASPLGMLKSIWTHMRIELEENKSRLKQPEVIDGIVSRILVPHVDQYRMAAATVGRHQWRKASKAERKDFVAAFRRLLIITYGAPLTSYDNDQVKFPSHVVTTNRRTVEVKTVIVRRTGQHIAVNYNLIHKEHGWKVYDFSIENASIVASYRAQFASVLASGGITALIVRLKSHNARVD